MNNTDVAGNDVGSEIKKNGLICLDIKTTLTKSELFKLETTIKFLGMRKMKEYCKYSMLKVADAHSYEI